MRFVGVAVVAVVANTWLACSDPYASETPVVDAGPRDALADAALDGARPCVATFCDDFDQPGRQSNLQGPWDRYFQAGAATIESDGDFTTSRSILFQYPPAAAGAQSGAFLEKRFDIVPASIRVSFQYRFDRGSEVGIAPALVLLRSSGTPQHTSIVTVGADGRLVLGEELPGDGGSQYPSQKLASKITPGRQTRFDITVSVSAEASLIALAIDRQDVGSRPLSAHLYRGPLTFILGDGSVTGTEGTWVFRVDDVAVEVK